MNDADMIDAGGFSDWLRAARNALSKRGGIDVPCGDCIACCSSSWFIRVRPEDTEALARIPQDLLFKAPGRPEGYLVMGYDDEGRCPMQDKGTCVIYEYRPLTCRHFDCRIFAAAGVDTGCEQDSPVARQARRWRFSYPTQRDRDEHAAVKMASAFLREHSERFPRDIVPSTSSPLAALAIKVHEVFLGRVDRAEDISQVDDILQEIMAARALFEKSVERPVARTLHNQT